MNALATLPVIDRLRARDGDECWACGGLLDFEAPPNSKKSPTKEHLHAKANGGSSKLANLVLCHPGCNKQLGTHSVEKKNAIRTKMRANRARQVAKTTEPAPPKSGMRPQPAVPQRVAEPASPKAATGFRVPSWWRLLALGASGVALLTTGMLIGLLLPR